jgi:hypothetical protein
MSCDVIPLGGSRQHRQCNPHPAAAVVSATADPSVRLAPIVSPLFAPVSPSPRSSERRQNVILSRDRATSDRMAFVRRCLLLREGDNPARGGVPDFAGSGLETVGGRPSNRLAILNSPVLARCSISPIRRTHVARITRFGTGMQALCLDLSD